MRWLLASLLFAASAAQATPALNPLFSDHGVLQRGRPIAIWGTAGPGEQVEYWRRVEAGGLQQLFSKRATELLDVTRQVHPVDLEQDRTSQ